MTKLLSQKNLKPSLNFIYIFSKVSTSFRLLPVQYCVPHSLQPLRQLYTRKILNDIVWCILRCVFLFCIFFLKEYSIIPCVLFKTGFAQHPVSSPPWSFKQDEKFISYLLVNNEYSFTPKVYFNTILPTCPLKHWHCIYYLFIFIDRSSFASLYVPSLPLSLQQKQGFIPRFWVIGSF